jgi:hypothetical protein
MPEHCTVNNDFRCSLPEKTVGTCFENWVIFYAGAQQTRLSKIDIPDKKAASATTCDPSDPKTWKGLWQTITNPIDIAKVSREANIQQYHQAHETPFGSGPQAQLIG